MSTFIDTSVSCPRCCAPVKGRIGVCINLNRHPQSLEYLEKGTFNHMQCTQCGQDIVYVRTVALIDFEKKQWLLSYPSWAEDYWRELERAVYHSTRLTLALSVPAEIGKLGPEGWCVRVVFGYPALREKLMIWREGLDEYAIENAKLHLIAKNPNLALQPLFLHDGRDDFLWQSLNGSFFETDKNLLERPWHRSFSKEALKSGAYVSHRRFLIEPRYPDPLLFELAGRSSPFGRLSPRSQVSLESKW